MEPEVGDDPIGFAPHPEDHSVVEQSPPPLPLPEDDGNNVVRVEDYDVDDSHLIGFAFSDARAFEPAEPSYDAAAAEEALPIIAEAEAHLGLSPIADAPSFEPSESTFEGTAGMVLEVTPLGPVKRKRGRPPKGQSAARKAPVTKKKEEEEVCFICFDGGNLVVCDRRGCPKVYHPACINRDEAFFRPRSRWNCGWHICSICEKAATYMCYTCTYSLCKGCIREASYFCARDQKGFCETCYSLIVMIESNGEANDEKVRVDFDDKTSWEYLFKVYWLTLKGKISLTLEELSNAKNSWKRSGASVSKDESSDDLYDAKNDLEASSDSSSLHRKGSISSRKKVAKRPRKSADVVNTAKGVDSEMKSLSDDNRWASPELLEFVVHMKDGDASVLSQFDVQALLLQYIKQNNLRDPRKKSQIICDTRLKNLFGKERVGHFEMLKLLETHFLVKEISPLNIYDNQGGTMDTDYSQIDDDEYNNLTSVSSDKRRKMRRRIGEREVQLNLDDYAAIDVHNINLIYLRRSLAEDLIGDVNFSEKVVGSFVRIRISGAGQKQEMYRLVQVIGTHVVAEQYKVGKKLTDIALDILNLNKMESSSIDAISNQEFTEEECKRLRQSIKCGLISRLTVRDILEKAKVLQEVRVNDWLESEKLRLSHLRDRASDLGRRKELRECVEKLHMLGTPEERQRRLGEVPEIHVDPHMDPTYESPEEAEDKKEDNSNRSREPLSRKRGKNLLSPGRGSVSNYPWNGTAKSSTTGWTPNRTEGAEDKIKELVPLGERKKELSRHETLKGQTHATIQETSAWKSNQLPSDPAPDSTVASPGVPVPSNSSENDKVWHYQDPSGKIQGPFTILQLRKWSSTGFFPPDLRVWHISQKQEESTFLTDVLKHNDLEQNPPPLVNFSQPQNFADVAANTGNNWDTGGRENQSLTLVGMKQNENHWNVNQNITMSGVAYSVPNTDRRAPQTSNLSEPNRELATQEGRIGVSARVWELPKDTNAWYKQGASYNLPSPGFSTSVTESPNSPVYQVIGAQAENAERWGRNQDQGSLWSSVHSRPNSQGYEEQHSSWIPLSQQAHQVSVQYQKIQSAKNSGNQLAKDAYSPPTTLQSSSIGWTSDGSHITAPSASVTTSVHAVRHGWEAVPSPELNQSGPDSMASKGSNSSSTLNQSAASNNWGSGSASSIAVADTKNFGKMENLNESSLSIQQRKSFGYSSTVSSGSFMKKSQFFESSCPSPTPSSERDDSPPVQMNEPASQKWGGAYGIVDAESDNTLLVSRQFDPNVSCLSAEVENTQSLLRSKNERADKITELTSLSFQPTAEADGLDIGSVQNTDCSGTNVASSVSRLDQTRIENPSHISAPADVLKDTKSTGSSYGWNVAVHSTPNKSQIDVLASSDSLLPPLSPNLQGTCTESAAMRNHTSGMVEDAGNRSWVTAPSNPNTSGVAYGTGVLGWGKGDQTKASTVNRVLAQGCPNVSWEAAQGTSTETGRIMPKLNSANVNIGWATPTLGNSTMDLGAQGNVNMNTGWVMPATGYINQNEGSNTSWETAFGGKNANWSSSAIYHDNSDFHRRHGGDWLRPGSESGLGGGNNPQTRGYFGGARGGASSGPVRGQAQKGICKFYESGHCKKGASCNYLHP